jgi:hypothetical protein
VGLQEDPERTRPTTTRVLIALVAATVLLGCAKGASPSTLPTHPAITPVPAPTATLGSGVNGSVVAGPTCPVERAGHPCPPHPVTDATVAADGHSTHTDGHGNFALKLLPGTYDVSVSSRSVMRCTGQRVQVDEHRYTHVTLSCDTGIR